MIRILDFMFVNNRNSNKQHITLTEVNGTQVFLFGHVKEQYDDRIKNFQKITGIESLVYDNLINSAVELINEKYDELLVRDFEDARRNVMIANIAIDCKGVRFNFEIQLLIKSTRLDYNRKHNSRALLPELVSLFRSNKVQMGDKVIAIETIVGILKKDRQENRDFKEQEEVIKIAKINLKDNQTSFRFTAEELFASFRGEKVCKSDLAIVLFNNATMKVDKKKAAKLLKNK